MPYRGEDFIGVHTEAVGDGQNDTQPVDTWHANRLWANTMWLSQNPRMTFWTPHVANAELREGSGAQAGTWPYALRGGFLSYVSAWVWVQPGQTGAELPVTGFVYSDEEQEARISYEAKLGTLVSDRGSWRIVADGSGDPKLCRHVLTLEFPEPFNGPVPELHWLRLAIKSLADGEVGAEIRTTATAYWAGDSAKATGVSPAFFADSFAGNPDDDSMERAMLGMGYDADGGQREYDLLGVTNDTVKGSAGTVGYLVQPNIPTFNDQAQAAQLYGIVYWAPRSVGYREIFSASSIDRMSQASLRANEPVDTAPSFRQAAAIHKLHSRRRAIYAGPRGEVRNGGSHQPYVTSGYPNRWPFMSGETYGTDGGGYRNLVSEAMYLTSEESQIHVVAWAACVNHEVESGQNAASWEIKEYNGSKAVVGGTSDTFGRATWAFDVTIEQLVDVPGGGATWTDVQQLGNVESDIVLQVMPAGRNLAFPPIARGLEHNHQKSAMWHKMGGLVPGLNDELYCQPLEFKLKVDGYTQEQCHRPVRIKIRAFHERATHALTWNNEVGGGLLDGGAFGYPQGADKWDKNYARIVEGTYVDNGSSGSMDARVLPGSDPPTVGEVVNLTTDGGRRVTITGVTQLPTPSNDYLREDVTADLNGPEFRVRLLLGHFTVYEQPLPPTV